MSKRRKSKNTRTDKPRKVRDVFVARPFESLPSEVEWVALRELIPAATAPLKLTGEFAEQAGDREIVLTTVLPLAWPVMTHADGRVLVALQRQFQSGDLSRDVAASLIAALSAEPGKQVAVPSRPGPGPRLQDMLSPEDLDVTVHDDFSYWLADEANAADPQVQASLERANASIFPTERLGRPGSHWCRTPDQVHVRYVLGDDEDAALRALARLSGDGTIKLTEDSKFAGMFRTNGLLVPVWDLAHDVPAADCEEPLAAWTTRYAEALKSDEPLTAAQRRARDGLIGRQLTLR